MHNLDMHRDIIIMYRPKIDFVNVFDTRRLMYMYVRVNVKNANPNPLLRNKKAHIIIGSV